MLLRFCFVPVPFMPPCCDLPSCPSLMPPYCPLRPLRFFAFPTGLPCSAWINFRYSVVNPSTFLYVYHPATCAGYHNRYLPVRTRWFRTILVYSSSRVYLHRFVRQCTSTLRSLVPRLFIHPSATIYTTTQPFMHTTYYVTHSPPVLLTTKVWNLPLPSRHIYLRLPTYHCLVLHLVPFPTPILRVLYSQNLCSVPLYYCTFAYYTHHLP